MAFQIIRNDITKVSADAIVNTANPKPKYVSGTDYAIYTAAGADELLKERQKIGNIETGQAAATPAFALSARYIIHTVGPAWVDGEHGEREAVSRQFLQTDALHLERQVGEKGAVRGDQAPAELVDIGLIDVRGLVYPLDIGLHGGVEGGIELSEQRHYLVTQLIAARVEGVVGAVVDVLQVVFREVLVNLGA